MSKDDNVVGMENLRIGKEITSHSQMLLIISALLEGHVLSSVELIKSLQGSSYEVKAMNLRALVTIVTTCFEVLSKTLDSIASMVLVWLEEAREIVATESNFPYFLAMTMRANGNKNWFIPDDKGDIKQIKLKMLTCCNFLKQPIDHKRLLWDLGNEEKLPMVKYLLSLPEIRDVKMDDGTTAFSMALGRGDLEMIDVFLHSEHQILNGEGSGTLTLSTN